MSWKIDPYQPNNPYVYCDCCGWRYHASETKMQWDNQRTCQPCWDERPDFFFRIPVFRQEGQPIRNPRPQAQIIYRPIGPIDYNALTPSNPE